MEKTETRGRKKGQKVGQYQVHYKGWYTLDERQYIMQNFYCKSVEQMARHLGRSEKSLKVLLTRMLRNKENRELMKGGKFCDTSYLFTILDNHEYNIIVTFNRRVPMEDLRPDRNTHTQIYAISLLSPSEYNMLHGEVPEIEMTASGNCRAELWDKLMNKINTFCR